MKASQYPYTLDRFFEHLREAVLYFPDSGNVKLNTFSWVRGLDDINSQTLNNDWRSAKTRYCISKRYEKKKTTLFEFDYPALLIEEAGHSIRDIFNPNLQSQKISYKLRLYVMDTFTNSKDVQNNKADRAMAEVHRDCRTIMQYVLKYFKNVKFAKIVNIDTSISYGYYHTGILAKLVTDNVITSYTTEDNNNALTQPQTIFELMLQANEETEFVNIEPIGAGNLCGVQIELQIESSVCINPTFDFTFESNDFIYGKNS